MTDTAPSPPTGTALRSDGSPADGAPASAGIFGGTYRFTSIGLLIVVTLVAFEAMAVSTAMPTAARELHGLAYYGWAFSGFIVANIIGMVVSGVLSDHRGPRLSLIAGLIAFLAGLLLTGAAGGMLQFVLGRIVQGFGAGLLVTAMYVVIGENYPAALQPKVLAATSSAWVVPSLVGPPLSGFVTEHLSWRWVFLGLAPLVVLGGVLITPHLRRMRAGEREWVPGRGRARLIRAVALAGGIAFIMQAAQHPDARWLVPAVGAVGAVGWGLLGLVPPGTLRVRPGVSAAVALRGLLAGAMFGVDSYIPLALTIQHGYAPTAAGLPLLTSALAWSVGSWWQGRDAMNGHRPLLIRIGFASLAIGCAGALVASLPTVPGWLMYFAWMFAGLGAGLGISSIGVLLLSQTNDTDRGRDASALQLSDAVATAFTTGLGGVLVAAAVHGRIGYTGAFVTLDLVMIVVASAGLVLAGRARARP